MNQAEVVQALVNAGELGLAGAVSGLPGNHVGFRTTNIPAQGQGLVEFWSAATGAAAQLPRKAVSYTQVARTWREAPGVTLAQASLIGLADSGEEFLQCWQEKSTRLKALELFVRPCMSGTGGNFGPYNDGGEVVKHITQGLMEPEEPGQAWVFYNQAGGAEKTRPDVAWCGIRKGVEIPSSGVYEHLQLALEYKTSEAMQSDPAINNGIGQLISRAGSALEAQTLSSFTLPGAVLDNFVMVPVIVVMSASGSGSNKLMMTNIKLQLVAPNAVGRTQGGSGPWKPCGHVIPGIQGAGAPLLGRCQGACHAGRCRPQQAGVLGGRQLRDCPVHGQRHGQGLLPGAAEAVPSHCLRLRVPRRGLPVRPLGAARRCRCGAPAGAQGGPGPGAGVPGPAPAPAPGTRNQVPREIQALRLLEGHALQSLPQLLNHGRLDVGSAAAGRCLQGAPVVVTQLLGEALVERGEVEEAVLPREEAECLMWDIFEALAVLQARGMQHCDVHPRNFGRRITASGASRFYLYDFGSAMTAAELAAGLQLHQPCSLLFSAVEVLLGRAPGPLADAVALVFSGLALAGACLPWSGPAAAGDVLTCVGRKVDFMADPAAQLPAWPHLFSPELRQLSEDVMSGAMAGHGHGSWLTERLARTSRGASSDKPSPSLELGERPDSSAHAAKDAATLDPYQHEGITCS